MYFLDLQCKEAQSVVYYIEDIEMVELSFNFTVKRSEVFNSDNHLQRAQEFYELLFVKAKILVSNCKIIDINGDANLVDFCKEKAFEDLEQ